MRSTRGLCTRRWSLAWQGHRWKRTPLWSWYWCRRLSMIRWQELGYTRGLEVVPMYSGESPETWQYFDQPVSGSMVCGRKMPYYISEYGISRLQAHEKDGMRAQPPTAKAHVRKDRRRGSVESWKGQSRWQQCFPERDELCTMSTMDRYNHPDGDIICQNGGKQTPKKNRPPKLKFTKQVHWQSPHTFNSGWRCGWASALLRSTSW